MAMANDRLRQAITAAHMDIESVARALGVDPKTVQRWLAGRVPRPRHRWALVDLLNEQEALLWPGVGSAAVSSVHTAEIVAAYPAWSSASPCLLDRWRPARGQRGVLAGGALHAGGARAARHAPPIRLRLEHDLEGARLQG